MGLLEKIIPSKDANKDKPLIADLDKLIDEPIYFRLFGKTHAIEPMVVETYFKTMSAIAKHQKIGEGIIKGGQIDEEKLLDVYFDQFQTCCKTITRDMLKQMTHSQIGAVRQLIHDAVVGKAQVHSETEKKT